MEDTKVYMRNLHKCSAANETSTDELFSVTRKQSAIKGNFDSAKATIHALGGKDNEIHLIR